MNVLDLFKELAVQNQHGWSYVDSTMLVLTIGDYRVMLNYDAAKKNLCISYHSEYSVESNCLNRLNEALNCLNFVDRSLVFTYDKSTQCLSCRTNVKVRCKKFRKDFKVAYSALEAMIGCWNEYVPQIQMAFENRHCPLENVLVSKIPSGVYIHHIGMTLH